MMLTVYSDGGSRGNPGPSAYAVVIANDNKIIYKYAEFIGMHTNNFAEYRGLIAGIGMILDLKCREVEFVMDSQLVVRQMREEYKVKSLEIKSLYNDAKALSSMIHKVRFRSVHRSDEYIPLADKLLNIEMDKFTSKQCRNL